MARRAPCATHLQRGCATCYSGRRRRRSALAITESELNVIAALAKMGLSTHPKKG